MRSFLVNAIIYHINFGNIHRFPRMHYTRRNRKISFGDLLSESFACSFDFNCTTNACIDIEWAQSSILTLTHRAQGLIELIR